MTKLIGNAVIGQSGGPTAAINSSAYGAIRAALDAPEIKCVYGAINGISGILNDNLIDLGKEDPSELAYMKNTPASALGSCRVRLDDPSVDDSAYKRILEIFKKYNIRYFFYNGGNDSMDTIKKLSNYAQEIGSDIRFMGVPKTIDNDLAVTDHTPGYGSAAKYIASAMKEIIRDVNTYPSESVTIVEIMGRNAGWLTAASALSRAEDCPGPDLIYLPEVVFDYDKFIEQVKEVKARKNAVIIAVSEGIKLANGEYVCEANKEATFEDSFGHKSLGGTALYLADYVGAQLGIKSRGIVFSTLQRCASHIVARRDITEAFMAGSEAVQAALNGETGKMIIFTRTSNEPYNIATSTYDVNKIANIEKVIPDEWIINDGTYVSDEFIAYCRPLIIGELIPFMVDGLPRHLYLD